MIKVAIIEDEHQLRHSLAELLDTAPDFICCGDYVNCESALKRMPENLPDVILMDIELPGMSGVEGVQRIKKLWPEIEILMLTIHEDNESVFNSLRNGASGYLIKNTPPAVLLNCIKEVLNGGAPMSMNIARMIINSFHERPPHIPLTDREHEVLHKLREGKSYQAIANELFISKSTVKFHIKNIYRKMHVHNRMEMMLKSLQND